MVTAARPNTPDSSATNGYRSAPNVPAVNPAQVRTTDTNRLDAGATVRTSRSGGSDGATTHTTAAVTTATIADTRAAAGTDGSATSCSSSTDGIAITLSCPNTPTRPP